MLARETVEHTDCQAISAAMENVLIIVGEKRFAVAVNCLDGRTQLPVTEYLKEKFKVDYVDVVTEAGPIRILADCRDRVLIDSIRRRVEISIGKHRSRHIAVVGHSDCAGNPVGDETQIEQILKSIKTVRSWNLKVEVLGLWVDDNWTVREIKER